MSGFFGHGKAIGHVGEILQGAVRRSGGTDPFLVTLPCAEFESVARVSRAEQWSITPSWKSKALRAAQLCPETCSPFSIQIASEIPTGRGCGSSTADCVATVRAIADLLGASWSNDKIAKIVQRAEGASDSTMYGFTPVAFLPRDGEVLQVLGETWPEMKLNVLDMGGPDVCTLQAGVPVYSEIELDEFPQLLEELHMAIQKGDVDGIGRVALRSAEIHQRHRPHANWPEVRDKALARGAAGVAIAHSGSVAAVLHRAGVPCRSC